MNSNNKTSKDELMKELWNDNRYKSKTEKDRKKQIVKKERQWKQHINYNPEELEY